MPKNISAMEEAALMAAQQRMDEDPLAPKDPEDTQSIVPQSVDDVTPRTLSEAFHVPSQSDSTGTDSNTTNKRKKSQKKESPKNNEPQPTPTTPKGTVITDDSDLDEELVGQVQSEIAQSQALQNADPFAPKAPSEASPSSPQKEIEMDDVYLVLPDIQGADRDQVATMLFNEIREYRDTMMRQHGWTAEEADQAAAKRLVNRGHIVNENYKREHPEATIIIDKTKSNEMQSSLTEEEHEKLETSRRINLIEVEDINLRTLTQKKIPPKISKVTYLRSLDAAISTYRVPLPIMGDYAQFTGAQTVELLNVFADEKPTDIDLATKKAELCYSRFYGSVNLRKYDDQHRLILSYEEFINAIPYRDLDMMVYGIFVASTPEVQPLYLSCGRQSCNKEFKMDVNMKTVIQTKDMPKFIQERIDDILRHTASVDYLHKLNDAWKVEKTYESPFTGNIYVMQQPTIAKALDVLSRQDENDDIKNFNLGMLFQLNSVSFKAGDEYITFNYSDNDDEVEEMLDAMREIPESDYKLILREIANSEYSIPFKVFPVCPHCDHHMTNEFTIRQLVFLKAQNMLGEIV